jgi:hypothetical protein
MDAIYQFLLVFVVAGLFFAHGARSKNLPMNRKTFIEICQAAAVVVLVFAFLSGGKGCASASGDATDCQPGPAIYGTC